MCRMLYVKCMLCVSITYCAHMFFVVFSMFCMYLCFKVGDYQAFKHINVCLSVLLYVTFSVS